MTLMPRFQTERPAPYAQTTVVSRSGEHRLIGAMKSAFEDAMAFRGRLRNEAYQVDGFSGRKFRLFLNNLIHDVTDARYLEIGLFHGASFCAAIALNHVTALGVDNWTEFNGRRDIFTRNLEINKPETADITIIEADFRKVDYPSFGPFNILFYDGSHKEVDQYDGVAMPQSAMDDSYILIVDDWNWPHVRKGTYDALRALRARIDYQIEVRTSFNDENLPLVHGKTSDWHNGCIIAAVSKQSASR